MQIEEEEHAGKSKTTWREQDRADLVRLSGKFKAANNKTKDFEPPSRMFDGIQVDTHSKVGIGVGYSASDGKISEKTFELAFDVTISTPEFL